MIREPLSKNIGVFTGGIPMRKATPARPGVETTPLKDLLALYRAASLEAVTSIFYAPPISIVGLNDAPDITEESNPELYLLLCEAFEEADAGTAELWK